MPTDHQQMLQGIPGEDAVATKRGFNYQDLATSLAWLRLKVNQVLHIEIAEDFAAEEDESVEITQVKNVAASLTLRGALSFLNKVVQHRENNQNKNLRFSFLTTAEIGFEKPALNLPGNMSGIAYWNAVRNGRDPLPLVKVLRELADKESELKTFLDASTDEEVHLHLINRVYWAASEPHIRKLEAQVAEELADFAYAEMHFSKYRGRLLLSNLVSLVNETSIKENVLERTLSYGDLLSFIKNSTQPSLTYPELENLTKDAALSKNPPVKQIDADIGDRLKLLRTKRFFPEANVVQLARELAEDVRDGGSCQLGTPGLRALVLSWCARVMFESDLSLAKEFLVDAESIADVANSSFVRALILAKSDIAAARAMLEGHTEPESFTIRFAIERNAPAPAGLQWVAESQLVPSDFDADGQFLILHEMLSQHFWNEAIDWQSKILSEALDACIALKRAVAFALIIAATPDAQREIAILGAPVAGELELRTTTEAFEARRKASIHFKEFHDNASALGLTGIAQAALESSLWLQLEDATTRHLAADQILTLWNQSSNRLRWTALVIRSGIDFDRAEIYGAIQRHKRIYGKLNAELALAQLSMVLDGSDESWATTWPQIRESIREFVTTNCISILDVRALLIQGLDEDARAMAAGSDFPAHLRARFELDIVSASPERELAVCRELASADSSLLAQRQLVMALRRAELFAEAITHARKIYLETWTLEDGKRLLSLYLKEGGWQDVVATIQNHFELAEQSPEVANMYCTALFNVGQWEQLRQFINSQRQEEIASKDIDAKLAIYSGRWGDLGSILENVQDFDAQSVDDLMQFAIISIALDRIALSKKFTKAAVAKADRAASVLFQAYILAVRGKWDGDLEVRDWFKESIALSDESGPVKQASLSDLAAMAPKWREKNERIAKAIASAEIYLAFVAQTLNRPLSSLIVSNAEQNLIEKDPARRVPIAAFAAIERPVLEVHPRVIALDATALLTIAELNLLDKVKSSFDRIYLPHSVGIWLFHELERVQFHQPRRIDEAEEVLHAIAKGEIRVSHVDRGLAPRLVTEFGREMAQLIDSAAKENSPHNPCFVIHPCPIYRPDSFMEQEADVTQYAHLLRSTVQVVSSLIHHGDISEQRFENAMAYLGPLDRGWPSENIIPAGATLYLDTLSVTFFQHVGLLKYLHASGFKIVIHPDLKSEAAELHELRESTRAITDVLEKIRKLLLDSNNSADNVSILPRPNSLAKQRRRRRTDQQEIEAVDASEDDDALDSGCVALLLQMFVEQDDIECVIFDDRAANRYLHMTKEKGTQFAVRSTLDVLDWLLKDSAISHKEWRSSRNELRKRGYIFIPLLAEELTAAMDSSSFIDGMLVESFDARVLRENYALGQASAMLQHPYETSWITTANLEIRSAIANLWSKSQLSDDVEVHGEWLVELSRPDGFASTLIPEFDSKLWLLLDAITISRLMLNTDIPRANLDRYNAWLENSYLNDLARNRPAVFDAICKHANESVVMIGNYVKAHESEIDPEERKTLALRMMGNAVNKLPFSIGEYFAEINPDLHSIGLVRSSEITLHLAGSPKLDAHTVYTIAGSVFDGAASQSIVDSLGTVWQLSAHEDGTAWAKQSEGAGNFQIVHAQLFAQDASVRGKYLVDLSQSLGLQSDQLKHWIGLADASRINIWQLSVFEDDLADTPTMMANKIRALFSGGISQPEELSPLSLRYYERLVGRHETGFTLERYCDDTKDFAFGVTQQQRLEFGLLRSIHSKASPCSAVIEMNSATLSEFVSNTLKGLDLWSLTGLVESIVQRQDAFTDLSETTISIIEHVIEIFQGGIERFQLTCSLAMRVDSALNVSGVFGDKPPYWRRLASFSHAALIERIVLDLRMPLENITEWASGASALFQACTLVDIAVEPRWHGSMLSAQQIRQEVLGRILNALWPHREALEAGKLAGRVFGESEESLELLREISYSVLPGPLEGAETAALQLPEDIVAQSTKYLDDVSRPLIDRVGTVAHVASMGSVPHSVIEGLTKATRDLDITADQDTSPNAFHRVLINLSLAAAGSRDKPLASAVHQLLRNRPSLPLPIRLHVGLTACACESDNNKWSLSVEEWIRWLATEQLSKDESSHILFVLSAMCDSNPVLRRKLGTPMAKLRASVLRAGI